MRKSKQYKVAMKLSLKLNSYNNVMVNWMTITIVHNGNLKDEKMII